MKSLTLLLCAVVLVSATAAAGQVRGIDVQVNEGKPIPSVVQLQAVLNPNDLVRDVLGWHRVDPNCNLATDPNATLTIPTGMQTLYGRVQAAQGQNFVTLAFDNKHCGQISNSGAVTFPDTDALRAEFAAYAVGVVNQVPALGGVSIWNEMNGSYGGGYGSEAQKLTQYCLLANAVIAEIRKVDQTLPIAIGATVGWSIDAWFIDMFDVYGCVGKGDPTIWLDVHPYLSGAFFGSDADWQLWDAAIANIRADGITNPLFASEWGSGAAYHWSLAHPTGDYLTTFDDKLQTNDPSSWAGLTWFELLHDKKNPNSGLFDATGVTLTTFGAQYVSAYKH